MPALSIIIPTHRRAAILQRCLEHLEAQTIASDLEVIVVSDTPDEKMSVRFAEQTWRIPVRFVDVPPCHQGAARNTGLQHARGTYVLFIGDDIFLSPDACEKHLKAQSQEPKVVLGFTSWDPSVGITPVMTWLEISGWQFGYPAIAAYAQGYVPADIQHRYSYTSHISLPLELAKIMPFRTDVHLYGWEDIEWGMRLQKRGVRLYYEPDARALHHHSITMDESLRRAEILGRSAAELARHVPSFDRVPRGGKLFLYTLAALLPTMAGKHRKAFLRGLYIARRRRQYTFHGA